MAQIRDTVQRVRQAAIAGLTDAQLLTCFLDRHDETAFTVLVGRHAGIVWGVCRRLLNHHDAEDAFQASFLVLFRKAASIRSRTLLSSWLYGVAYQTALQARRTVARRTKREKQVPTMPEPSLNDREARHDLHGVLDDELSRLPDRYRVVLVLCDLEGNARKDVARQLDCPEGTVAGRLARARTMLAKRLTQRGIALSGGALAAFLSQNVVSAVPTSLVQVTARIGMGGPVRVVALAEGVMKTMLLTKLKSVLAVVVMIGMATLLSSTTTVAEHHGRKWAGVDSIARVDQADNALIAAEQENAPKSDHERMQGTWTLMSAESDGEPVPENAIRPVFGVLLVFSQKNKELMTLRVGADTLTFMGNTEATYKLDPKTPKVIELQHLVGALKGHWTKNAYRLDGDRLTLCLHDSKDAPPELVTKQGDGRLLLVLKRQAAAGTAKKMALAWGKPVGGLQAGLGIRPYRKVYHHGETVTLVVRVRNVGNEAVKFQYIRQFLDENPPNVTSADGKKIPQHATDVFGFHGPVETTLAPGEETELESRFGGGAGKPGYRYELRPAKDDGEPTTKEQPLSVGPGKVTLQYKQVIGNTSSGRLEGDPMLKLATGKLELQVQDAEKREDTAWGKEVGGLQAGVSISNRNDIQIGGKATAVVKLRNVSNKSIATSVWPLWLTGPRVVDSQGKQVRATRAPQPDFEIIPTKITLQPGQTVELAKSTIFVAGAEDADQPVPEGVVDQFTIYVRPGTYKARFAGFLQGLPTLATDEVEFNVKDAVEATAWGKPVGGVQAGLVLLPGQKRVYRHGETVTLAVHVRNIGKESVKFQYLHVGDKRLNGFPELKQVLTEPLSVTNDKRKPIGRNRPAAMPPGRRIPHRQSGCGTDIAVRFHAGCARVGMFPIAR